MFYAITNSRPTNVVLQKHLLEKGEKYLQELKEEYLKHMNQVIN